MLASGRPRRPTFLRVAAARSADARDPDMGLVGRHPEINSQWRTEASGLTGSRPAERANGLGRVASAMRFPPSIRTMSSPGSPTRVYSWARGDCWRYGVRVSLAGLEKAPGWPATSNRDANSPIMTVDALVGAEGIF